MAVNDLTLEEKIGQMVMCGFHGTAKSKEIEELIEHYHIGGVIYFSRNIETVEQVHGLSESLQSFNRNKSDIPLFISVDQEGGMVARITEGLTLMPGNMALGAAGKEDFVYRTAAVSGTELTALGINFNLAPCVDVNNNRSNPVIGVRSYGSSSSLVTRMGTEAVKGYQDSGVAAAAKHFPGHGDTDTDSHLDLPKIKHSMGRMEKVELPPFKEAVNNGVDAVMTAHIIFPELDKEYPGTLSPAIIEGLLREKAGFNGVICTDCMEMKAIADYYGTEKAAVKAINAGADIVLISHSYEKQVNTLQEIKEAVKEGIISERRIDEAVQRIRHLKEKRNMGEGHLPWEEAEKLLRRPENVSLVQHVRDKSVTCVKGDKQRLELKKTVETLVLSVDPYIQSEADERLSGAGTFGQAMEEEGFRVNEIAVSPALSEEEMASLIKTAGQYHQLIFCSYNAGERSRQVKLVQKLYSKHPDMTVIGLRSPYDIDSFPYVKTFITGYENRSDTLRSIAGALSGRIIPEGVMPG